MLVSHQRVYEESQTLDLSTEGHSAPIATRGFEAGSVQLNWVNLDSKSVQAWIEESNDAINWNLNQVDPSSICKLNTATDSQNWLITKFTSKWIRLAYTLSDTSTDAATLLFEGRRYN